MQVSFTQTKEYLSWQMSVGKETFYKEFFDSENNIMAICACVILELKIGKVLYCPFGPTLLPPLYKGGAGGVEKVEKEVRKYLKELGKKENCVFVRMEKSEENKNLQVLGSPVARQEVPWPRAGQTCKFLFSSLFPPPVRTYKKEGIFQPRLEWCLDLNVTELEIYENFSKNCKYSIRRADKEILNGNMKVEIVTDNFKNYLGDFLQIMHETGERNGFINHEDKYFERVFESLELGQKKEDGLNVLKGFLIVCKIDETIVNMALIIFHRKICESKVGESNDLTANYVFGGSRDYKRELGATFKTQWEAIKQAKRMGATEYNLGGITGEWEGDIWGRETLQGVTNFKKQFWGYEKFNGYFYDIPIRKFKYFLYLLYKYFKV